MKRWYFGIPDEMRIRLWTALYYCLFNMIYISFLGNVIGGQLV